MRRVVLCIGYLAGMIEDVVGSGECFGLQVVYSPDGRTLLGTGDAPLPKGRIRSRRTIENFNFFDMAQLRRTTL